MKVQCIQVTREQSNHRDGNKDKPGVNYYYCFDLVDKIGKEHYFDVTVSAHSDVVRVLEEKQKTIKNAVDRILWLTVKKEFEEQIKGGKEKSRDEFLPKPTVHLRESHGDIDISQVEVDEKGCPMEPFSLNVPVSFLSEDDFGISDYK